MSKIVGICAAAVFAFTLTACNDAPNYDLSELRDGYYTGGDSNYTITAVSGMRESDYAFDGVKSDTVDYTLVTLEPNEFLSSDVYSYQITLGDSLFAGQFTLHPFAASYSVELPINAKNADFNLSLIKNKTFVKSFDIVSLCNSDTISYSQALDIALTRLNKKSAASREGYELYARLVQDGSNLNWYVRLTCPDSTLGVLLNSSSGEIIAVREP